MMEHLYDDWREKCFIFEYSDDVLHIVSSHLDWYSVADHSETVNYNSNLDTKITLKLSAQFQGRKISSSKDFLSRLPSVGSVGSSWK